MSFLKPLALKNIRHFTSSTSFSSSKTNVTLIPGDGIGPEISQALVNIYKAAQVPINFETATIVIPSVPNTPVDLTEAIESISRNKIALKGPLATPIGKGHVSLNLRFRKKFNLYANVRPCLTIPAVKTNYKDVNLVIIRENTEGEYSGLEHEVVDGVYQNIKLITGQASARVCDFAFNYAIENNRKKVTVVHKAGIMKKSDGLFLACAKKVSSNYPQMEWDDITLDEACFQITKNPSKFDVMVMPNLYGDIMSDLSSGLVGGLGVAPSANFGLNGFSLFEAVHGSAPSIAGQDMANPTAFLFSSIMMLRHLKLNQHADRIQNAIMKTLAQEVKTADLGGQYRCSQYTEKIIENL